ncbi:sugar ABC transporter ATP-binding protein [Rhodopirellula sp. MGV]|uniref:sugar ABC transporter ATP-binding protein n=1 Tax=Rhodopirellula sp. MGV TaxID=2023130 RepID=UPI0026C59D28
MVEIAAALARQCKLLILDEPTAALSGAETERLFEQLDVLKQRGVGMIYISHRLDEVKRMADRVTVLRDGRCVGTESVDNLSTDDMVDLMSGKQNVARESPGHITLHPFKSFIADDQPSALQVRSLSCGIVRDFSFSVKCGEKFGITGLVGSGRTELLRAIFGADVAESGAVQVGNRFPQRFRHPRHAVQSGLAMVTEDRKDNGLLLSQSIRHNVSLASLRQRFSRLGLIQQTREGTVSQQLCKQLQTRCTSDDQLAGTLSGGNQQKVVISKWLSSDADVYLFDEPTRGIDVGARRRIYQLLDEIASTGKGIVIVSSDLDELFETCDRIAVMNQGQLIRTFSRGEWSEDLILQASFERPPHSPVGVQQ